MKTRPLFSKYLLVTILLLFLINPLTAIQRPKVGLVLSGGGAMGFAHIGTLKLLDSLHIPVDVISGTSMGGIAGALYAVGYTGKEIEEIARRVDWQKTFTDRPPRYKLPYFQKQDAEKYQFELGIKDFLPIGPGGAIVGQNIMLLFSELVFDYADVFDFDSLPIPFRCVAVDLITGNEVVLKNGSLAKAMRSTMAVPSIFSPVEWGDSLLVDGGLTNNLPVNVARDMGADIIIASVVGNPNKERQEIRSTIDVLSQSFNILRDKTMYKNMEDADILIDTKLYGLGPADFVNKKVVMIIQAGEAAALAMSDSLLALKKRYYLEYTDYSKEYELPDSSAYISEVTINGNVVIPEVAIREIVRVQENRIFSADSMDYYIKKLKATGDFSWVRYSTEPLDKSHIRVNVNLEEKKHPIIYGIQIFGNETLPFDFIYRLLGVKPGDIFINSQIEDRITYLYSLGYFQNIYYDIEPVSLNVVRFNLHVKESPDLKIRLGLRYDNYYKLVAALNLLIMNKPLPGLRIENEFQFIGKESFRSRAYYPSRTMNFPLYPFVGIEYQNEVLHVYNRHGNREATYRNRFTQFGCGLGLLYKNYWNVEAAWIYDMANVYPLVAAEDPQQYPSWKDEVWEMTLTTNIDKLDDTFIPRSGVLINANYDKSIQATESWSDYIRMDVSADFYKTFGTRHTIHGYGFYGSVDMDSLTNKFILKGGPDNCIGMEYFQIMATTLSVARLDYRYQFGNNLYLSLITSSIISHENDVILPGFKLDPIFAYGVGLKYVSALGPVELIVSRGKKSAYLPSDFRTVIYFKAGFIF